MRVPRGAEGAGSTKPIASYEAHSLQLRGLGALGEVQIGSTKCDEPSAKRANIQWQGWVQPPTVRLCGAVTEDVLKYTEDPAAAQFAAASDWILRCNTVQDVWVSLMPELFMLTAQAGARPPAAGCSGLCVAKMRSARKVNDDRPAQEFASQAHAEAPAAAACRLPRRRRSPPATLLRRLAALLRHRCWAPRSIL